MAVTIIREIRNNSSSPVTLRNRAKKDHAVVDLQPGGSRELLNVEVAVPWCGDGRNFHERHIEVNVGSRRFVMWQASHDDADFVRMSTDGAWHSAGDILGGLAAVGFLEEVVDLRERTLVINDFTLWLLPFAVSKTFKNMSARAQREGFRICGNPVDRPIDSVPKKLCVAFSMAGPPSDALDQKQPGASFLYRDSGKRYEFQLDDGVVFHVQPDGTKTPLREAITYSEKRRGEQFEAPLFDLIAAAAGTCWPRRWAGIGFSPS
jgi:hypothetical protein